MENQHLNQATYIYRDNIQTKDTHYSINVLPTDFFSYNTIDTLPYE